MKKLIILAVAGLGASAAFASLITAREMTLEKSVRTAAGEIGWVQLGFGADNGLTNRLYVAYGDADGGVHRENWAHVEALGDIAAGTASTNLVPPKAKFVRYFLDVFFGGDVAYTPVKWINSDGTAYADTRLAIQGGDELKAVVRTACSEGGIMGSRHTVSIECANAVVSGNSVTMDYNSSAYGDYRLTGVAISQGTWYEFVLSPALRSVKAVGADEPIDFDDTPNSDTFTCRYTCGLFKVLGNAAVTATLAGSIASFTVKRGEGYASYCEPFRCGETYGFFDRARGCFIAAAEGGTFGGEEDASLASSLTSVSDLLETLPPTGEAVPRSVSAATISGKRIRLTFGADNGLANRLFVAYGTKAGGLTPDSWQNVVDVGVVRGWTDGMDYELPVGARYSRFFLYLPFDGTVPPEQLKYVRGDGTGYFDTGITGKGGDEIEVRVRPRALRDLQIFGSRNSGVANDPNVVFLLTSATKFQIDYTGGNCLGHRCTSSTIDYQDYSLWYDLKASPAARSVTLVGGDQIGMNDTPCDTAFETTGTCHLFASSGFQPVDNRLTGDIACLKVNRDGAPFVCWRPCKLGDAYGFYDTISRTFHAAEEGSFTGEADVEQSRFVSSSDVCKIPCGFMILFR